MSPQLTCDNGMSPDTWSNEDPSPSLCHPLPPVSSVQMTGRMTDLWYDCPMFVLTAPPHLAKYGMKSVREQPCCPSTDLGQPCGKLPRPDLAKPCLEIPSAAGYFEQWCGVSCPCYLWEFHLSHNKDPPSSGKPQANRVWQLLPKPWKCEDKSAAWRAREQKLSFTSLKHQ